MVWCLLPCLAPYFDRIWKMRLISYLWPFIAANCKYATFSHATFSVDVSQFVTIEWKTERLKQKKWKEEQPWAAFFDFSSSSWSSLNMNVDLLQDSEVNWQYVIKIKKIPELMDYAHYEFFFMALFYWVYWDNANPHTAAIITEWLRSRRVRVLNWPAYSPGLSPIENIWCIIKQKIRQRRPQTLQQLETYIRQEWDQIPTPKLQKLITSMPRRLQSVLKRRGDATQW